VLCEALRNVHLDSLLFFLSVFVIGLRSERKCVVGDRQAGLEITDDRAEKARREKSRPRRSFHSGTPSRPSGGG
jgi:hypothetical protein